MSQTTFESVNLGDAGVVTAEAQALQMPAEMRVALRAGEVLSRSLKLLFKNFAPFMILSALVHLPTLVLVLRASTGEPEAIGSYLRYKTLLDLVLANVSAGVMTYAVFMQMRGTRVGIGASVAVGFRRLLPVIVVGALQTVLMLLGVLAFVIPGIVVQLMLFVAVPATVVEKPGVFGALQRSRKLTQGFKGTIFGVSFVIGVATIAALIVIGLVLGAFGAYEGGLGLAYLLTSWVFGLASGAWQAIAATVVYHDLRAIKDGVQVDELARVFD